MNFSINFDDSSKAWMANKIRRGERTVYRCQAIKADGDQCCLSACPKKAAAILLCGVHARHAKFVDSNKAKSGKSERSKDSA
jgi:hypothetical protein